MFTLQTKEISQSLGISPKVLLAKLHALSVSPMLLTCIHTYTVIYTNHFALGWEKHPYKPIFLNLFFILSHSLIESF